LIFNALIYFKISFNFRQVNSIENLYNLDLKEDKATTIDSFDYENGKEVNDEEEIKGEEAAIVDDAISQPPMRKKSAVKTKHKIVIKKHKKNRF
jgi:hypothetical protein